MRFLCVCYYDIEKFSRFTPADFEEMGRICSPHDKALQESGKVAMIGSLGMPHEFRTLRAQNKSVRVENGPYEQTKEPFGAFFLVEAANIDEAVEIARLHPGTHLGHLCGGGIEVRPIDNLVRLPA